MNVAELAELGPRWATIITTQAQTKNNSISQPRPVIHVSPGSIGPVQEPNMNDVLCGRGGRINAHAGNVQFRVLVQNRKQEYLGPGIKKLAKAHIAASVVQEIRNMEPAGRFLKEDADESWYDIGDSKAIKKAGQALREYAPDIRTELKQSGDFSGDYGNKKVGRRSKSKPTEPAAESTADPADEPADEAAASMLMLRLLLKRKTPCR